MLNMRFNTNPLKYMYIEPSIKHTMTAPTPAPTFDVALSIAYSISWAMSIVEDHDNAVLYINVKYCTPAERFLIASIRARKGCNMQGYHSSDYWIAWATDVDLTKDTVSLTHIKDESKKQEIFELRIYEDDISVLATVFNKETNTCVSDYVLLFWQKTSLNISNTAYGPGINRLSDPRQVC